VLGVYQTCRREEIRVSASRLGAGEQLWEPVLFGVIVVSEQCRRVVNRRIFGVQGSDWSIANQSIFRMTVSKVPRVLCGLPLAKRLSSKQVLLAQLSGAASYMIPSAAQSPSDDMHREYAEQIIAKRLDLELHNRYRFPATGVTRGSRHTSLPIGRPSRRLVALLCLLRITVMSR